MPVSDARRRARGPLHTPEVVDDLADEKQELDHEEAEAGRRQLGNVDGTCKPDRNCDGDGADGRLGRPHAAVQLQGRLGDRLVATGAGDEVLPAVAATVAGVVALYKQALDVPSAPRAARVSLVPRVLALVITLPILGFIVVVAHAVRKYDLVAITREHRDKLGSDESTAANDDDFHDHSLSFSA